MMTTHPEGSAVGNAKRNVEESFCLDPWTFLGVRGHILNKGQEERFNAELNLPHLPDMVFSSNVIRLTHSSGVGIELNPMDALRRVNDHEDLVHVSLSKDWLEARGTLFSNSASAEMKVTSTEERINYKRLQEKEKILFFQEIILFEDELDDNGVSVLTAKLRVMPSGFFCLLRFYLRVDNTLVRVIDTRFYHELGKSYVLREYTERESTFDDLQVSPTLARDQNEIVNHLTIKKEIMEKLDLSHE